MTYKVNNIDDKAFGRLDQLSNINCRASNPPVVQDSSFAYSNLITLHVLSGKKEIYQNANLWQKFNIKDDLLPIEGDSLVFDKQIYAVKVGNIEEVHLAMHPIDADVKDVSVQWSSSDSSIVIIGKSNKFRGFKLGQATITATTTENPKLTASAIVYVTEDGNLPEEVITGTTRIKVSTPSKHYFDLQGRRYDKPFKGINILGGKKIVF